MDHMENSLRFLILDDNDERALLYRYKLGNEGMEASYERATTVMELEAAIDRGGFDMVISDFFAANIDAVGALRVIKEKNRSSPS